MKNKKEPLEQQPVFNKRAKRASSKRYSGIVARVFILARLIACIGCAIES